MNLSFFIARKYFFSGKNKTFINIISIISMVVVAGCTAALIIILSVFNGLEGILRDIYGSFDAQITLTPKEGKSFVLEDSLLTSIRSIDGISGVTEVIEDNALLKYKETERIVRLKGVSQEFNMERRFSEALKYGDMTLRNDSVGFAILGRGVQYQLGINYQDDFHPLQLYYPKDIRPGQINPEKMFTLRHILPGSVFAIEKSLDDSYVFVPIEFSEELMNYWGRRTALEIDVSEGANISTITSNLTRRFGEDFLIQTGDQLHSSLYRIFQWEKIFVFLTGGMVLVIGSINLFFALSMLVIDKKKDIALLQSIGMNSSLLKKIFMTEGALISFVGAALGMAFGLSISYLQQQFGFVKIGIPGAVSPSYPVEIEWLDVLVTAAVVIAITVLACIKPAFTAAKQADLHLLQ